MKRQIGILMAVWLIVSTFTSVLRADTSYLLIQGPFGSGGAEVTYKWKVNYPAGYLISGQDLLNAVFGAPVADGTYSDPSFPDKPYFVAGNAAEGAGYLEFFGDLLTLSFTLNSTFVPTDDDPPLGTSTVGWNYYVAGGSGTYGGTYPNNGTWDSAGDGPSTRRLVNGSYDGWVFGNTGYDSSGSPATTGSMTAVISDTTDSDSPSDFLNQGVSDIVAVLNPDLVGKYTILLSPTDTSVSVPQSPGYAIMTVGKKGGVITAGKLPDGESFSASGVVVSDTTGRMVVINKALSYPSVTVRNTKGMLSGTLTFVTTAGATDPVGTLAWTKPQQKRGDYQTEFDTNLDAAGSPYTPPAIHGSVLPGFVSGSLELSDTGTLSVSGSTQLTKDVTLTARNALTITNRGADKLSVVIVPTSGVFKGTFIYPGQTKRTGFSGVLIQNQTDGAGFFIGPNGSGTVNLAP